MATLRDQIVELESENVAKKDWVMMGEAGSRQRPQNSLLEEDLEFDRVMKAVPIVTEEAVQSLEETIKARILEGRFDDVIRLRPLDDKPFLPSKFFELQDTKSTQSLAQIYENDYISTQSGVSTDDRDGKLKKEQHEISQHWEKICGKLDALCNAHFVPKQVLFSRRLLTLTCYSFIVCFSAESDNIHHSQRSNSCIRVTPAHIYVDRNYARSGGDICDFIFLATRSK